MRLLVPTTGCFGATSRIQKRSRGLGAVGSGETWVGRGGREEGLQVSEEIWARGTHGGPAGREDDSRKRRGETAQSGEAQLLGSCDEGGQGALGGGGKERPAAVRMWGGELPGSEEGDPACPRAAQAHPQDGAAWPTWRAAPPQG